MQEWRSGDTRIRESNPPMSWKAASSFPYKVSRPAQSKQAMPSKYPPRRHTRGVSRATLSPEFLSPMLWRRESPWHLQPDGYRPGVRVRVGESVHECDGHRLGAYAVAHDAAGGVGGVEERLLISEIARDLQS